MPPLTENDGNPNQLLDPRTVSPTDQSISETTTGTEDTFSERSSTCVLASRLSALKPGLKLNKYEISKETVEGKPHIRFATNTLSSQAVVLKFYASRDSFENALRINDKLEAQYVCKPVDSIDDNAFGLPPCLVFERGYTLNTWLQRRPLELSKRRAILHEVLECLKHIHAHDIVHGDITPRSIVFSSSTQSWKLFGVDTGLKKGDACDACPACSTSFYIAPEVLHAADAGEAWIADPSMDMWSFGILAFEVLTGKRFYGESATIDTVKDCLCGRRELPSLEDIEERQTRRWLCGLLSMDAEERWSAARALSHAVFKTAEDTTQMTAGFRQVGQSCLSCERTVTRGRTYEVRLRNIGSLLKDEEVESKRFEAGGKDWKLAVLIYEHNCRRYDVVKVALVSCNEEAVGTFVELALEVNGKLVPVAAPGRNWCIAGAFDVMISHEIPVDKLVNATEFEPDDELVVTIDLKDVALATKAQQCQIGGGRTVSLEVIDDHSINAWLNGNKSFGLAAATRTWNSDVCGRSLTRCWASRSPDCRYWLCKRYKDGKVSIKRYLNEAPLLERFEDICKEDNGGYPWVTVFEETKDSSKSFDPVDENAFIIFCKLFTPPYDDLSYLGHFIVQKSMPCQVLLTRIMDEMLISLCGRRFNAYVEREGQRVEDITPVLGPLPEHGTDVGYVIILRLSSADESYVCLQDVQGTLRAIHGRLEKRSMMSPELTGKASSAFRSEQQGLQFNKGRNEQRALKDGSQTADSESVDWTKLPHAEDLSRMSDSSANTTVSVSSREEITSIQLLVDALNDPRESTDLLLLRECARRCVEWFQIHVDDITAKQIEEYMCFSRLKTERPKNKDLLHDWFQSLCGALGQSGNNYTQIVEALEIALLTVDKNIFLGNAKQLVYLSKELLHKITEPMEYTKESYNKHGAAFLALEHAVNALYNISGMLLDQTSPDTYQAFMELLETIGRQESAHYPFRYQSKMIIQDLKSLEAGVSHHGALCSSIAETFQCMSDICDNVEEQEKKDANEIACGVLRDIFCHATIPDLWYEAIQALHCVSVEVFRKPQLYPLAEVVFDALCDNDTYISDKEIRMAIRFSIIGQLQMIVKHCSDDDTIRSLAARKLVSLAEASEENKWTQDPEILEAMLDTLCAVYDTSTDQDCKHSPLKTIPDFQNPDLRDALRRRITNRLTEERRIHNEMEEQEDTLFSLVNKEFQAVNLNEGS